MARVDTLPEMYRPLMMAGSIRAPHCVVCGRTYPLNQHHIVRRSAGKLYRNGMALPKPTVTLCGFGNNLRDADGRPYCHGLAHHGMLHFRWTGSVALKGSAMEPYDVNGGHLEYLRTDEPVGYLEALEMDGWRPLGRWYG